MNPIKLLDYYSFDDFSPCVLMPDKRIEYLSRGMNDEKTGFSPYRIVGFIGIDPKTFYPLLFR